MKQFHAFRLDTVNHCLWRGEERVSLAPKAFDVLRYLVEHADRLVTQDEILNALWPETYVNPEVIKKYILGIRKALGDPRDQPEYIETFPRRGYHFIAPVSEVVPGTGSGVGVKASRRMVGREWAMAELDGFLSGALNSQRQVAFITGEAGIGKTTLVDAFHQGVACRPNLRILRGQCVEGFGGKEAYYPVLEAIGQWVRESSGGSVAQTLAKLAPTWLIQFPSLIKPEQREALQKEIQGATRERMVREICEALEALTAQDPLVLVLEDLHWVDPSTLDFLSAVARGRRPAKLLVLGTYRPADLILSKSPLKALKQDLVLHGLSHEINLERLEEPDVADYLEIHFAGGDFPERFANLIYRHSGGNALFLVNILQDMVKRALIARVDGRWTLKAGLEDVQPRVPETLDQLIEAQFQQLSSEEQRLLRSASVAGERFSVWAISPAAEMEADTIEEACERLADRLQFIKAAGINVLSNGQISAHYEFRHSLYREVLYRRLSEAVRTKLHLQLAQRFSAFCDPCEQEQATELALHFECGRNYEQAIHYLVLGAKNATGRFAYRDSIEILRHGLELAAKLSPALRDELEVPILESLGGAYFALGALGESAQAYTATARRAQQAGLKEAQLRALIAAMYPLGFIDPAQGLAAMEEAVKISRSVNDPARLAQTEMIASGCRLVFDTWSKADAELCRASYEAAVRLDPSGLNAYQRVVYAHILLLEGRYHEAIELSEGGVPPADPSVSMMAHFGALSVKTSSLLRMGQLGKALQITRAGRARPEENLARYWLLSFREAWLHIVAFDFDGARQICQSTGKVGGEHPDGQGYTIDQMAAGYAAFHSENYAQAIEHFRNAEATPTGTMFFLNWAWRMMAQLQLIHVLLRSGDVLQARAEGDRCLEPMLSVGDPQMLALAWETKAQLALAQNDLAEARDCVQRAIKFVDKFEILVTAWKVFATAWQVYHQAKEDKLATTYRERAESCILTIADSFESDEPLRATFLAGAPIRRILGEKVAAKGARNRKLRAAEGKM
jgi:DNA-binding winged helix-turn-helix (wHTH) protein/tetratricopeptide (TPR) repeat protein